MLGMRMYSCPGCGQLFRLTPGGHFVAYSVNGIHCTVCLSPNEMWKTTHAK